jgi:hypothetical protein
MFNQLKSFNPLKSAKNKANGLFKSFKKSKKIKGGATNTVCNNYIRIYSKIQLCINELNKLLSKENEFAECIKLNIIFKKLKETKAKLTLALEKLNK